MIAWFKEMWSRLGTGRPTTANAAAGALGESAAADYLQKREGYTVVTRNWHSTRDARDEIDLVCLDGEVMVFVEVKARSERALVTGYHQIDKRKKRALRRAVHVYLSSLAHPPRTFRFDVVEVSLSGRLPPQVMHFENVPLFPKGYYAARQTGSLDEIGA